MKGISIALFVTLALTIACEDCNTRRLIYHEFKGKENPWGKFGQQSLRNAEYPDQCIPLTVRYEHDWNKCCYLEIFYENAETGEHEKATGCYPVPQNKLDGSYHEFKKYLKGISAAVDKENKFVKNPEAFILCSDDMTPAFHNGLFLQTKKKAGRR